MKFSVFAVAIIVLLAGLFHFFEPKTGDPPRPAVVAAPAPTPAPRVAAESPVAAASGASQSDASAKVVDLVIAKGTLVSGPSVVQVKQNEHVIFHIKSDSADEVHLHGYNLHLRLAPGQLETLDFIADKTGRFTYELHHAGVELGALEIYPR